MKDSTVTNISTGLIIFLGLYVGFLGLSNHNLEKTYSEKITDLEKKLHQAQINGFQAVQLLQQRRGIGVAPGIVSSSMDGHRNTG